tara:strand:+ start:540 stop:800 length:261 start_codon:yes stop_codon:yes gene_type:complete
MEELKNKIELIENEINNTDNDNDKVKLYKSLISELKLLYEKAFIEYLLMKKRDEKRVNYTKKYYEDHKEKIKHTAKEHYNKNKKSS